MATPTLPNPPNRHQWFAEIVGLFAPPSYPKPRSEFRVFPTGEAESHWSIVASGISRTISRHKSLTLALRKCTRLNEQRGEAQLDLLKVGFAGFPDVIAIASHYEGARNEAD